MATQPDSIDKTPIEKETTQLIYIRTNFDTTTAVRAFLTDTLSIIKDKFLIAHMAVNPWLGEIRVRTLKVKRKGCLYGLPDDLPVIDVFKASKIWCLTADCIKVLTCDLMQISHNPSSSKGLNDRLLSPPVEVGADLQRDGFSAGDTEIRAGRKRKRRQGENVCKDNSGVNFESVVTDNYLAGNKLQNDGNNLKGVSVKKSNQKAGFIYVAIKNAVGTSDAMQEVKSEGKKRKKPKKKGTKVQNMPHLEHDEAVKTVEKEAEGHLSLNHADNVMLLSRSETPECTEKEVTKKPTSSLPDPSEANIVSEHQIFDGTGKRKNKRDKKRCEEKEKFSTGTKNKVNIAISQTEHILEYDDDTIKENIGNVTDFPVEKKNEILESNQTGKNKKDVGGKGKKSKNERKKSQVTESGVQENLPIKDSSISSEANEKLPTGNETEAIIMISQTEQRFEYGGTNKENAGNDADFPVVEKENEILESNQEDKNKKDVGDKGKKPKKKRKKSRVAESDVQDNFPIKGSSITSSEANEKLPTGNENETSIVISQTEQALEYDGTDRENMGNEADFPVLEKGNEILESIKVDKGNEDACVTGRKYEKKNQKSRVSESDVQADSRIKGAHISSSGANEKLPTCNENESNSVISQTKQTLDDDSTKKKNKVSDADCPVLVKEKEILKSNLADKNNKGKTDEDKNKRKKSQVTVSDVQENISIKDKTVSAEIKENIAIKGAHIVSSQLVPDKSEEHPKMVNGPAVVTADHDIDFRLHFVHEKDQHKVTSGDNMKVVSQSNDEMETGKNVKKDVLPSISAVSDLHNSLSSSDKQDSENKSSLKEGARGMRSGDSKLNSQNLVKGSKRMVAASSHSGDKNSSLAELSMKRSETLPSNKQVKKRHLLLDANTKMVMKTPQEKSSLIKSQAPFQDRSKKSITDKMMLMKTSEKNLFTKSGSIFQGKNSINKMMLMKTPEKNLFTKSGSIFQGKNSINKMMLMRTPEKKNLFTKPGSIFQDNSIEDDVDENGRIVTSDSSTDDSSDSSSESDDSEGESEMSHNFGSEDGKGISNSSMLEMHTILRSSQRFKKAKLIASQTEPEPDELLSMEAN